MDRVFASAGGCIFGPKSTEKEQMSPKVVGVWTGKPRKRANESEEGACSDRKAQEKSK